MVVTLTGVNQIFMHICTNYKKRFFFSAYLQAFALTDCEIMRTTVAAHYFALRAIEMMRFGKSRRITITIGSDNSFSRYLNYLTFFRFELLLQKIGQTYLAHKA